MLAQSRGDLGLDQCAGAFLVRQPQTRGGGLKISGGDQAGADPELHCVRAQAGEPTAKEMNQRIGPASEGEQHEQAEVERAGMFGRLQRVGPGRDLQD